MPDIKKNARGAKRPGGPAGKRADAPLLGEAALKAAAAGFSAAPPKNGGAATSGAAAPKTVAQVMGEITWLMTQSPRHKAIPLGDLEWLVMPAILLRQFRMFYKGEQPVGVALWAMADRLVSKRIDAGDRRLTAAEWKSGSIMRIVDIVAPFGGEAEMRNQLGGA